jgi:hypothetical protein
MCVLFFNDTDDFITHFPRRKCEICVCCFLMTLMILPHIFVGENVRYMCAVFLNDTEQFGARELVDSCRNETANLPTNMERKSCNAQNGRLLHCRYLVTF